MLAVADVEHLLEDPHSGRHEEGEGQDADAREPSGEGGVCRVAGLLLKAVRRE